jgi:ubiquinone/menaquinone biosynthesis C-methylase UbiE
MVASERYTHGHHPSVVSQHARRTAGEAAAILMPHLKPDMRVLDVGCGPGSITVGLAEAVAPGEVVGIDVDDQVLELARTHAAERDRQNVSFQKASIYDGSFSNESFDAVFAHQVLQHLARPLDALLQMKRVVKTGGAVAVRDGDYSSMVFAPANGEVAEFLSLYKAVARRNGGEPDAGRYLKGWLRQAGFSDISVATVTWTYADRTSAINWGDSWAERITQSAFAQQALGYSLATEDDLERIAVGWRRWAREDDAFFAFIQVAALGWKA